MLLIRFFVPAELFQTICFRNTNQFYYVIVNKDVKIGNTVAVDSHYIYGKMLFPPKITAYCWYGMIVTSEKKN